jgi:uncharacterized protein YjbI with pentapeptide repeats
MKIEIKHRFSGEVLFAHDVEGNTIRLTLEAAVKAKVNLYGADFSGADLYGADLSGANLSWANLSGANLSWANLSGANLYGANLSGANLYGANLYGANLYRVDLDGETLTKPPLSLLNLEWPVLITEGFMRIGCQRHTHEDWAAFSDEQIEDMASTAVDFWDIWKEPLLMLCTKHRGTK